MFAESNGKIVEKVPVQVALKIRSDARTQSLRAIENSNVRDAAIRIGVCRFIRERFRYRWRIVYCPGLKRRGNRPLAVSEFRFIDHARRNRPSQIADHVLAGSVDRRASHTGEIGSGKKALGEILGSFILHGAPEEVQLLADVVVEANQILTGVVQLGIGKI